MAKIRRLLLIATSLTIFLLMVVSFQNCTVQRPAVAPAELASAFSHEGITTNCVGCHAPDFPPPHFAINGADCNACHKPGVGWTLNQHSPKPLACAGCHADGAPYAMYPAGHRPTGGRDCISCHVTSGFSPGDFQIDGLGHQPRATSCAPCHDPQRPAFAKLPDGQGQKNGHYVGKDCIDCHEPAQPKFVYQHVSALKQKVGYCLPCHESLGRAIHPSNAAYFVGDGQCHTCHTSTTIWRPQPAVPSEAE